MNSGKFSRNILTGGDSSLGSRVPGSCGPVIMLIINPTKIVVVQPIAEYQRYESRYKLKTLRSTKYEIS